MQEKKCNYLEMVAFNHSQIMKWIHSKIFFSKGEALFVID